MTAPADDARGSEIPGQKSPRGVAPARFDPCLRTQMQGWTPAAGTGDQVAVQPPGRPGHRRAGVVQRSDARALYAMASASLDDGVTGNHLDAGVARGPHPGAAGVAPHIDTATTSRPTRCQSSAAR